VPVAPPSNENERRHRTAQRTARGCALLFTPSRRRADNCPRFSNNIRKFKGRRPLIYSPAPISRQHRHHSGGRSPCGSTRLGISHALRFRALRIPSAPRSPHACTRCFLIDSLHSKCRSTLLRRATPPYPPRPRGHPAQSLLTLLPQDHPQVCCLMARLHPGAARQSAKSARQPPTTAIATPPVCDRSIRRESASMGVRVGNGRG
jgi:hypothetical protein